MGFSTNRIALASGWTQRLPLVAVFVFLCALLPMPTMANTPDCGEMASTREIVECWSADTKRWDARLNRAYQALLLGLTTKEGKQAWRKAQRAWITYRDASCALFKLGEGSIAAVEAAMCLNKFARERALELEGDEKPSAVQPYGTQTGPTEEIVILGQRFALRPVQQEHPLRPWHEVKGYLPPELFENPKGHLTKDQIRAHVDRLASARGASYEADINLKTDEHLAEFLEKTPQANRDWFSLELAGMCFANQTSPYLEPKTLRTCQEYQALDNLRSMLKAN